MELMIAARKAIPELQLEHGVAVDRVYTGTFMTSLDMAGQFTQEAFGVLKKPLFTNWIMKLLWYRIFYIYYEVR